MRDNQNEQGSKDETEAEDIKSKPNRLGGVQTKRMSRRVTVLNTLGGIVLAFAGISVSAGHRAEVWIWSLFIAVLLFAWGLRTYLKNLGAKHRNANLWALFIGLGGLILCGCLQYQSFTKEDRFSGLMLPASNDPPVGLIPGLTRPTNSIILLLGGNEVVFFGKSSVPIIEFDGKELLTLGRRGNAAWVSGDFFSANGDLVATIETNAFLVNDKQALRILRPDRSSLLVVDQKKVTVLNIRYVNPSTFLLTGVLRLPNSREIIITKDQTFLPNGGCVQSVNVTLNGGAVFSNSRTLHPCFWRL